MILQEVLSVVFLALHAETRPSLDLIFIILRNILPIVPMVLLLLLLSLLRCGNVRGKQ